MIGNRQGLPFNIGCILFLGAYLFAHKKNAPNKRIAIWGYFNTGFILYYGAVQLLLDLSMSAILSEASICSDLTGEED